MLADEVARTRSDRKLRKALTTWDLLFLSLGGIIGSGWLFAALDASAIAGPAAIISWIIGGVIVLIIALNYAELGAMIPRSGSIVRYGQFSHGNLAGFFLAWAYFLSAVSVPAIEAEGVVGYAAAYYPSLYTSSGVLTITGIIFAGLLMTLFFFLNYLGVKMMAKTNTGMTWWKLILPLGTIIVLVVVHFNIANFTTLAVPAAGATGFMPYGFAPVMGAVATSGIVFSFLGFRQGLDYAGEAKTPQKSVPLATIFSVVIGIVVYVGLQVAFIGAVSFHSLGVPAGSWSAFLPNSNNVFATSALKVLYSAPFATIASSVGLVALTYLLFADAYISPSGTLSVYLGTSMRTLFGMGTLGLLPKQLTKVNEKRRIPVLPLILTLIIGFIFFAPFPSWYKLVGFITSATVFTYLVGGPAVRIFRKHASELKRPFTLKGSMILSPIAFVGASLIVYWSGWPLVGDLAIAIYIGLVVYLIFYFIHTASGDRSVISIFSARYVKAGIWVPVYILVLSLESFIGESYLGGSNFVPYPYDLIMVVVVAVVFYIWAVMSGIKSDEIKQMIESDSQYVQMEEFGEGGAR